MLTLSSLYLILSSALANFCFFLLTVRLRGSLLLASLRFCFSLFLLIFSLFFVCHFSFFGGSTSFISNLGLPSDITRFTVPWLKFLNTQDGFGRFSGIVCLDEKKTDSGEWKFGLLSRNKQKNKQIKPNRPTFTNQVFLKLELIKTAGKVIYFLFARGQKNYLEKMDDDGLTSEETLLRLRNKAFAILI